VAATRKNRETLKEELRVAFADFAGQPLVRAHIESPLLVCLPSSLTPPAHALPIPEIGGHSDFFDFP